jgi:hypothetical protein
MSPVAGRLGPGTCKKCPPGPAATLGGSAPGLCPAPEAWAGGPSYLPILGTGGNAVQRVI